MVKILGILNITEDSFLKSSRAMGDRAIERAQKLFDEGADILDIGPAASNPDALPVTPEEEIHRIKPVLDSLADKLDRVSIDSFQPETQQYAIDRGVGYVNDIQGFPYEALYPELAKSNCKLIVMHSVQRMGKAKREVGLSPEEALPAITAFFETRVNELIRAGVARERLILDPGMGFFLSSNPNTSYHVLMHLNEFKKYFDLPVLISVSRKSFLKAVVNKAAENLGTASFAVELFAIEQGADYIRTHSPELLKDALLVRNKLKNLI